ncbi:MAG: hypothetical protein RHS_4964 [Robinsoniella sp. RHS]|nr:MAG: hypothetical protein RHS_4964 [Robinsoniella sp. RHS]
MHFSFLSPETVNNSHIISHFSVHYIRASILSFPGSVFPFYGYKTEVENI